MIRIEHSIIGMCATNTYYAYNEESGRGFIVDPAADAQRIFDRVEALGFKPEAILLTHGHFDHILAVDEVRERYGIKAYIGRNEEQVLHSPELNLTAAFMGIPVTLDADVYLEDNKEFEIAGYKVRAIEITGHTAGGMCYYFKDENILFSGDTLFNESIGRSDFPGGSASALCRGIKEKLYTLPEDTRVLPGHMDETTIGYEMRYNPFCR